MLQYTVYPSINFIHGSFTISSFPLLATELNQTMSKALINS